MFNTHLLKRHKLPVLLSLLTGLWLSAACNPDLLRRPKLPVMPTLLPTFTPVAPTTSVNFQPDAVKLQVKTLVDKLDRPVFVTHAGDGSGRLFIVEKPGAIRIYRAGKLLATPFLDIKDQVKSSGSEQGLLGLAFAPDYAQSGYFFVNYIDVDGNTVIARFQVSTSNPDQADAKRAFKVLQIKQPAANHNGGMLAFAADGKLFIGMGDGGGGGDTYGNGQNPQTLLGKLLRIDVTSQPDQPYVVPPDNPWVKAKWNDQEMKPEVWALGLRNPWRFSFDRQTHDLWIGDVGQNQYEEINFVPATSKGGLNFGWPYREGLHCYKDDENCNMLGLTPPVAEYEHSHGCSVTGGYVYRGKTFPVLNGIYLYGDYCQGNIWATWPAPDRTWRTAQLLDTDLSISAFGEDEAGELYVTDLSGGTVSQVVVEK